MTEKDVDNFLADFNIHNSGEISMEDFKGVEFIRFDFQSGEQEKEKDII